jgi:(4-(4-[2-(gamma-L-glutamylamino)ethyl]phenoxymethyl)furan-2-yl)methanamine synthase
MAALAEIVGWDIGGVHTKAAWLPGGELERATWASRVCEIWQAGDELPAVLGNVYAALGAGKPDAMAVTMTAELADVFESKRQGVLFVLDAVRRTFPDVAVWLLGLDRELHTLEAALERPSLFAAANWLASALFVAGRVPNCLLVDVGSTTTDIIPILDGQVLTQGSSDVERLAAGELVYTGVVRTNPNTVAARVPIRGRPCPVAAESFAQMGDVYALLGLLAPGDYTVPTADGGPKTISGAERRLARLVCADAETLSSHELAGLAWYLHEKQLQQVVEAMYQVQSRLSGGPLPLLAAGSGRFLALEAGRRLGLSPVTLDVPSAILPVLPCLAVAALLQRHLAGSGT